MSQDTRPGPSPAFPIVETGWSDAVLVCRHCSRKLKGGFGPDGRQKLAKALRRLIRDTGQRGRLTVIDVGCLAVCPKRAVTILQASQPDRLRVIPKGTRPAMLAQLLQSGAAAREIDG